MAVKTNSNINGKEYFRIRKTIGKDTNGKAIIKNFYGASKKEAEQKAKDYIDALENGINVDYKTITIEQLTDIWLYDVKLYDSSFKPGSFQRYEGIYRNYIKDKDIGHLRVFYTSSIDIQTYYNKLSENNKTYSQINSLNKVLSGMFEYAIQEGFSRKNPCSKKIISIPKPVVEKFDEVDDDEDNDSESYFDIEELYQIIAECNKRIKNNDTDYLPYLILFSVGTGVRQGEASGLQERYFSKNQIKIRKELARIKVFEGRKVVGYKYKLIPPKSKTSIRNIDIANYLYSIMKKYIQNVVKPTYKSNNKIFDKSSLLFVNSSCGFIDQSNLRKKWISFLEEINIPYRKWHALRHGFACLLFDNGVDVVTVSKLLGHSDIKITAGIYLHVFPEQSKGAINCMEKILSG